MSVNKAVEHALKHTFHMVLHNRELHEAVSGTTKRIGNSFNKIFNKDA
jgi:hypothetical protein